MPVMGAFRSLDFLYRHARFIGNVNEIQRAARAEALCMVIRRPDRSPLDGYAVDKHVVLSK
jgi:hypothetical protein